MNGQTLASRQEVPIPGDSSHVPGQFDQPGQSSHYTGGGPNTSERDRLILENLAIVERVVGRLGARLPSSIDRDDLHSVGMPLITAAERFDSSQAVQFKTYAEVRVRGAMIDYLRSMSWAPQPVSESPPAR